MNPSKFFLKLAIVFGALAVVIGAFGAHGLKDLLLSNNRLDVYEKAVMYQFFHTFALLFTAFLMRSFSSKYLIWAARFFTMGIFVFSGSLYALAITNFTVLGAITPVGGVCFILGWIFLYVFVSSKAYNT